MPAEDAAKAGASGAPCGACRTLRRRCVPGCVFAPYFTAEDFAAVHGVFGASNVSKMLERVELPEQRAVAAATLVEEAKARAADPTFGRVAYLRILQEVNDKARAQVDEARAEIAREFGALAAAQPVDVAAAAPAARVEARKQVDAALKHAREQDARLLGVRRDNEVRWREMHPEEGAGTTGKHAGDGKGTDAKRHREPTLLMPPRAAKQQRKPLGFPDERGSHQQMAAAEAEREKALLMRQVAVPAKQHGHHHLAAQHGETGPPRVPEVYGNGQLLQKMSEASREEAMMRSARALAAAPPQHLDSAGQHAGTGQPRHAGDGAAGRTPGQGSTSVLLEAMMQLAGAGDEQHQQQHLAAQHADKEYDITQDMMQLQELLDMGHMAELARKQKMMKDGVMTEMGQWNAAAGGAMEQDVMTMMQQIPANTWQHSDHAAQYTGMRDGPHDQEMSQQMEEASTAELAQRTGNMSQQFAWAQQYHYHDPAAVHRASPWHHHMAQAHQQATASASQAASEQDMLLLLQQHQVAAAESLSAGGARQFNNLGAQYDDTQYDDTELTLGYGHPDMHQQQHAQTGLDVALGNGHPDAETQAMLQELAALLEHGGKQEMIREQDVMTMTQQDPDDVWLLEKLEQIEKESMTGLAKRLEIMSRQAEARHAQKELGTTEMARKQEVLMRQFVAAERAREQELIAQQAAAALQHPVAQSSEKKRKLEMLMRQFAAAGRAREQELTTQQAAAAQQHPVAQSSEKKRKLEMLMKQFVAAERAREQGLITQQAAAAQQHSVAQQYSGTELDMSPGQGHPYWHQPTVQQMLQEKQLPTVQQMLQEQQLADAVGFGRHQPNTTSAQQDAAYASGEHGSGAGATMAFLSPESAKAAPFLADQQPQLNGHQLGSSLLPPLPPSSSSQLHAQASHLQRTDGWRWPGPGL